jgi:NTE family protein
MRALVLSGGGSRGAYQAGVILRLAELGHTWCEMAGVSVGALNAGLMAQYGPHEQIAGANHLIKMWTTISGNKSVYREWWCGKLGGLIYGGVYNTAPLRKLISDNLDHGKLITSGVSLKIGAVSLETGEYRYVTKDQPNLVDWIMASSAFPFAFPPVKIDGEHWLDGGIRDVSPVRDVLYSAVDGVDVVLSKPVGHLDNISGKPMTNVLNLGLRTIDIMSDEIFTNDLEAHYGRISVYAPREGSILQDPLSFNQKQIQSAIMDGYSSVVWK